MNNKEKQFKDLFIECRRDPNILGLLLAGSRGKGMITRLSDYDAILFVRDHIAYKYKRKYKNYGGRDFDLSIMTLPEFKKYAAWGSPMAWDRYNFAHLKVTLDKTGKIQKMVAKKRTVPVGARKQFIAAALDHYINQVFRFVKNFRDGNKEAAYLEAAESIPPLLDALFALEGRVKPYHKYLRWELTNFPLRKLPWSTNKLINDLLKILKNPDFKTQQEILKKVEKLFRREGFGKVFDGWKGKDKWIMNYKQ